MTALERSGERRSAEAILAEWRAAERERDEAETGSVAWIELDHVVDELRHEYHDTVTLRLAEDGQA
jgi:hypothetical protein